MLAVVWEKTIGQEKLFFTLFIYLLYLFCPLIIFVFVLYCVFCFLIDYFFLIIEERAGIKSGLKSLKHFSLNQQENDHPVQH